MRVYLSSYRLGRQAAVLHRRGGSALIVMNALDEFDQRLSSWNRETNDLAELGYSSEELDLRDYWGVDAAALPPTLSRADLVWVVGGNSFVLARAAAQAGLADALAANQRLTYAGYSAGACLASIDLLGIDLMDDAETLPPGYWPEMASKTLGLTDTRVIPHSGTADARAAATSLRERQLSFIELRDGDDWLLEAPPLTFG